MKVLTESRSYDRMKRQHKRLRGDSFFVPGEGQRDLLCCNKKSLRCPSSVINPNSPAVSREMALDYLAGVLVEAYFDHLDYERDKSKKSSDILPRINKGASGGWQ